MISAFGRLRRDRSWCDLGFGQSASVYLRRASFLDQNVRLFSIGDVKTCWFIITYSRLTPDSLKIRFFVQIDFFAAHGGQGGVNGGSEGTKDLLAWSPNNAVRFGVFTVPSFVNCMISQGFPMIYQASFCMKIIRWV